jgi:hypothetical protein
MASAIVTWLEEAVAKIKKASEDAVKGIENIPEAAMSQIVGIDNLVVKLVSLIFPGVVEMIPDGITKGIDVMKGKYETKIKETVPVAYKYLKDMGLIDQAGIDTLDKITAPFGAFKPLINIMFIVMTVINYITAIQSSTMGKILQQYNSALAPNTLDANSAVRLAAVAPELYKKAHEILRKNGLDDSDIDALFISNYRLYDETTVRDLFWRKEITAEQARVRLREMQYTDTRIDELSKLWNVIPPIQDIITMSVREVFSPTQRAELGLDESFPEEVAQWSEKMGMQKSWAENYWAMHWQLPSPQMGFEMLHRGKITEQELRALLKALDYSPRWHDSLMGISYNVMTRVDLRRIYELGLIDDNGLVTKYKEMGYSPTDAEMLSKWTRIEYNQENKDVTKSELLNLYFEGFIESAELYSQLETLGYKKDRIDTMVELASYKRAFAGQKAFINTLKRLYMSGEATSNNVQAELASYKIDPRRVAEMIDQWDLEKKASVTLPLKADVDAWFKSGIINEGDYRLELKRLGYNDHYIEMYVKVIKSSATGE